MLSSLGMITSLSFASIPPALAESKNIDYTLRAQGNQSFAALMQQAESISGNLVEQAFAQSPSVTEVCVTIVGEHNGQEVPLLFSRVSRANWHMKPKIQLWTLRSTNSAVLLGFLKPKVTVTRSVPKKPVSEPVAASMSDIEINFYQQLKRR